MTVPEQQDPSADLTLLEAARLLGMSVGTIARWAETGRLRYVVVAGEKRFVRSDLNAIAIRSDQSDG